MIYLTIIIINNIVYFIQDSLDCFPFIAYCSWMGSNKRKKCEKKRRIRGLNGNGTNARLWNLVKHRFC